MLVVTRIAQCLVRAEKQNLNTKRKSEMKRDKIIACIACIFIVIIGVVSITSAYNKNQKDNDTVLIETRDVTITHLDMEILSPSERYFYASVLNKRENIALVVEINESQYVLLNIGDNTTLQKETSGDKVKYAIVNVVNKLV